MEETIFFEPNRTGKCKIIWCNAVGGIEEKELAEETVLGRKSSHMSPDIVLNSPIVSRRHGKFIKQGDDYYYFDVGSGNGTWVDDRYLKVLPGEEKTGVKLQEGSVIRIKVKDDKRKSDEIVMIFTNSYTASGKWESICLNESMVELEIGRDKNLDIEIDDRSVSRKHAVFFNADSGWSVIDQGSKNGVYVNHRKVQNPIMLNAMDVIRIARRVFFFTGDKLIYQKEEVNKMIGQDEENTRETLSITIYERNVWERFKKKTLLQDIKIDIKQYEMVLILGGSGAGKTTFMNAVMGYEKAEGEILYGDTDIYAQYQKMKYEIGFVPQQDLLRGSDTVFDTLFNAAEMKLPTRITEMERLERVNEVLHLLGLEREKSSLVIKLSGGQRKRLSIAVEFIANPSLFFLDEPDSGLDGIMARSLMENLKYIAQTGKIVMVITHAPNRADDLFDKVIVLAKSLRDNCGHLAFFGSVQESYSYFGTNKLEGIVKKINRKDEGGEGLSDYFIDKYKGGIS